MRPSTLLPLALPLGVVQAQASGSGTTTRYWDCCKPSCAWRENVGAGASGVVGTCSIDDVPLGAAGASAPSGCGSGGQAYMCSSHSPWQVTPDLAYGWAAVRIAGSSEAGWCCACVSAGHRMNSLVTGLLTRAYL
jgi:glycosyl hydrolase family 45